MNRYTWGVFTDSHSSLWQRIIVGLFHLLLIVTPFLFTWVNEELFEFNKMIFTYAMTVLIAGVWITRMIIERRIILQRTVFDWFIAAFFISQVGATILSIHPYTSIFGYYTRFHGGLLSITSYILLYYAWVSNVKRQDWPLLLASLFVSSIGVAAYAIPEHFGHSPSCWLISNGEHFSTSCWIQDVQTRIFGTFGQPNWLAAYAIMVAPIAASLWTRPLQEKQWLRWVSLPALILMTLVVLYTKSRSGFLGLAGGLAVWTALSGIYFVRNKDSHLELTKLIRHGLIGLASVGVIIALAGSPFSPSLGSLVQDQAATPETESAAQTPPPANRLDIGGTGSGEIRKIVWEGAFKIWRRYPWFGSGVETFGYSYYLDRPMAHNLVSEWDYLYNKAHNEFLNYLATTGMIGLGAYLLLLAGIGWIGIRICLDQTAESDEALLAAGLTAAIVALSISNFFGFSTVMVTVLMYLSMGWLALIWQRRTHDEETTADHDVSTTELESSQWLGLGLVGFFTLYLLFMVYSTWSADFLYSRGQQWENQGEYAQGLQVLNRAVQKAPQEALFHDTLSLSYARLAYTLAETGQATAAAQFADQAIMHSNEAITRNPVHLNFYRTRTQLFTYLSILNPEYLAEAERVVDAAMKRAPTDAKLVYNKALIQEEQGNIDQAITYLERTIEMKPNYEGPRVRLAELYVQQDMIDKAIEQYQYILDHIAVKPEYESRIQELESGGYNSSL